MSNEALKGRDLISTQQWSVDELGQLLDLAEELKQKRAQGEPHAYLRDRVLMMLFFFTSTRTRASFEAAMAQLGGHAEFIDHRTTQISHGDTAKEIGQILGRYGDGIAIRQCDWKVGNAYIRQVAEASPTPIYNMQCDIYHPFQVLADLMTIREKKGKDLKGRKLAVSWAYAASYQKPISVPQSLVLLMTRFGMDVTLAHPPEYKLMPEVLEQARKNAAQAGGKFELVHDMAEGFQEADVVYPKSWGCLLHTEAPEESARVGTRYQGWITDAAMMSHAKSDVIYMHCLPADRNLEVTDEVIDGPQSVVYDEAENRLHVQKASLVLTMK